MKAKPHELFASIKAIETDRQRQEEIDHSGDKDKLVSSGFLNKLVSNAKGWDVEIK